MIGSVPLDPVLQWREQLITDSDVWARHVAKISKGDDACVDVVAVLLQCTPRRRPDPVSTCAISRWPATEVDRNSVCELPEFFMLELLR